MYSFMRRVAMSECAQNKKMSVCGIVASLSDCEQFHIETLTHINKYCNAHKIGGFVAYRQIEINRLPVFGEDIVLSAHLYDAGSVLCHRNTLIDTPKGERLVTGYTFGAFVGIESGIPSRIPDEVIRTYCPDARENMKLLPRKISVPDIALAEAPRVMVTSRFIDLNLHMNNVHYATFAFDALDEQFDPKRIRIEYKTAAKQGDIIRPLTCAPEPGLRTVVLAGDGDTVYARVEFLK